MKPATEPQVAETAQPLFWDFLLNENELLIRLHSSGRAAPFGRMAEKLKEHVASKLLPETTEVAGDGNGVTIRFPAKEPENVDRSGPLSERQMRVIDEVLASLKLGRVRGQSIQNIVNYITNLPNVRENTRQPLRYRQDIPRERER